MCLVILAGVLLTLVGCAETFKEVQWTCPPDKPQAIAECEYEVEKFIPSPPVPMAGVNANKPWMMTGRQNEMMNRCLALKGCRREK